MNTSKIKAVRNKLSAWCVVALLCSSASILAGEAKSQVQDQLCDSECVSVKAQKAAVAAVMKQYKDAIQNLNIDNTFTLFTDNSQVFEQGGVEGSYRHYVEHHLGPELGHFKSFDFTDYAIEIVLAGDYAFTTETYHYKIVLQPDDQGNSREIVKKGLATSILHKSDAGWKIFKTHSSSRQPK